MFLALLVDEQEPRQMLQEDVFELVGHAAVERWRTVVNADREYGQEDGERDHLYCKHQILAQYGHHQARRRHHLEKRQKEQCQRQQNRNTQGDFLAAFDRQTKHHNCEETKADAWYYQVYCVEQGFAPNWQIKFYILKQN